jgi:NAD(P)-dependent dehydrogenase (short-subunit alcohol dehydrogenase family)
MNRFTGKTVLITGGSSGIGYAAAQAFIAEGARVVITGRDTDALAKAKKELGVLTVRNDVGAAGAAVALAHEVKELRLKLDAVFVNAGIAKFVAFADASEALWDQTFDINVKGAYFQIQALLPLLNPGASIVLNGSINAHIGMPNSSIYSASKAALVSMAKTLSAELIASKVRVNVISPGPIATPIFGKLGLDAQALEATSAAIQSQIPLGRIGQPHEIASAVLHLASSESAYTVGTEIIIDGGMSQL